MARIANLLLICLVNNSDKIFIKWSSNIMVCKPDFVSRSLDGMEHVIMLNFYLQLYV